MQLMVIYFFAGPISLGLNGDFTLIDPADWSITTTIVGHQGPITCFAADNANGACYTGSGNGDFIRWDADGSATRYGWLFLFLTSMTELNCGVFSHIMKLC